MKPDTPNALEPLPTGCWDAALSGVAQDMQGAPINVHKLMAHNPALLNAWWNFRNHAVNGGTLGPRAGELVILRVSMHLGAWYEWGSHVGRALGAGLTAEDINRVAERSLPGGWNDKDATLLDAVDGLFAERGLSRAMQTRLAMYFSIEQVLDLIAIQGMYLILGTMIKTWQPELDTKVAENLPAEFSQDAFELACRAFKI